MVYEKKKTKKKRFIGFWVFSLGCFSCVCLFVVCCSEAKTCWLKIIGKDKVDKAKIIGKIIGSRPVAEMFYVGVLGCTLDPVAKFHMNLGQQQFHLNEASDFDAHVIIKGSMAVAVSSVETLRTRISDVGPQLSSHTTRCCFHAVDHGSSFTLTDPWGNTYRVYSCDHVVTAPGTQTTTMERVHGSHGMSVRGRPGIRYVQFPCRDPSAIAVFYETVFGCRTYRGENNDVAVAVGPGVHFVFTKDDTVTREESERAVGIHVCVYIARFREAYETLQSRGLIWTNPRFAYLDTCETYEVALRNRQFRFKSLGDFDLEHETRATTHVQFLKAIHNI